MLRLRRPKRTEIYEPRKRSTTLRWDIRCIDPQGRMRWEERNIPNLFHDGGEQYMLEVVFSQAQSVPLQYFIGLDDRSTISETDDENGLSGEPSGNGYTRQSLQASSNDWTVELNSGDYRALSTTVNFTGSGGSIGPVQNMFLIASGSPLLASVALSQSRTIGDGDSLQTNISVKLTE